MYNINIKNASINVIDLRGSTVGEAYSRMILLCAH